MTDHYREAVRAIEHARAQTDALRAEYDQHNRPRVVAELHQDIGRALKFAQIHAQLSTTQALHDLGLSR